MGVESLEMERVKTWRSGSTGKAEIQKGIYRCAVEEGGGKRCSP
jgi:hypothetical protein